MYLYVQLTKNYIFVSFNSAKTLNNIWTYAFTAVLNWQDKLINEVFYLYMYSSAMIIISVVVKIPFNCSPCKDIASPKGSFANGFNSKE